MFVKIVLLFGDILLPQTSRLTIIQCVSCKIVAVVVVVVVVEITLFTGV